MEYIDISIRSRLEKARNNKNQKTREGVLIEETDSQYSSYKDFADLVGWLDREIHRQEIRKL